MTGTGKTTKTITSSGDTLIDGVLSGYAWDGGSITYAFPTQASDYSYSGERDNGFATISAMQQNAALYAMEQSFGNAGNDGFSIEGFTNANFSAGANGTATLRFAQSTSANPTAYAYYPSTGPKGGDTWFGTQFDYRSPVAGDYAWHTMLHELGHALGLKHGHETDTFGALPANVDSLEYSVMTYRTYQGDDTSGYSYEGYGAPQTYMMSDIAALQHMYGADYTTNSGDTVYSWTPGSGNTLVNGEIAIQPGANRVFATVWDGGGNDTYDLSAYTTDVQLDLSAGSKSTFSKAQLAYLSGGPNGGYASGNIYNALLFKGNLASLIENAVGGSGNDTITGNQANNFLTGGKGNDTLNGGAGNDTAVFSGARVNYAIKKNGDGSYTVTDLRGAGFDGVDVVTQTEFLQFSDGRFIISETPTDLPPTAPILSNASFTENLRVGTLIGTLSASDPEEQALTFSVGVVKDSKGNVVSSDLFTVVNNTLLTNRIFDYEKHKFYTVELISRDPQGHQTTATGTLAVKDAVDFLSGSSRNDRLTGGVGKDVITGNGGNDTLIGDKGNDVLKGGTGNDKLIGGLGADDLYGGTGADKFIFKVIAESTVASKGRDTIFDFKASEGDKIDLSLIDASTKSGGNQAFSFIGTDSFSKTAGELRVVKLKSDTYIYADVNGDGKSDFAIHLDDPITMDKGMFIL